MKYELTQHAYDVIASREIQLYWIELAVDSADLYVVVSEIEIHFFKSIEEASNKCLKVVANPTNIATTKRNFFIYVKFISLLSLSTLSFFSHSQSL